MMQLEVPRLCREPHRQGNSTSTTPLPRGASVITGEVGMGKPTSMGYAASRLHPSEYRLLSTIATTGSMVELLLGAAEKKQVPALSIDEAHLLRTEVFAQMHFISQHRFDS